MPVRIGKIPGTGATAFLHTCETCGTDAYFGFGVKFNRALMALDKGQIEWAKDLLGRWFCQDCK